MESPKLLNLSELQYFDVESILRSNYIDNVVPQENQMIFKDVRKMGWVLLGTLREVRLAWQQQGKSEIFEFLQNHNILMQSQSMKMMPFSRMIRRF